jgi:hypothetical protein
VPACEVGIDHSTECSHGIAHVVAVPVLLRAQFQQGRRNGIAGGDCEQITEATVAQGPLTSVGGTVLVWAMKTHIFIALYQLRLQGMSQKARNCWRTVKTATGSITAIC